MTTIKQISRLAGVSRGTVDRVLNGRGSVSPDTERKVREIADALNYSPNITGKTLAVRKKQLKFGFVLLGSIASNPFFSDMVRGIEAKEEELAEYGVTVEKRFVPVREHVALPHKEVIRSMDELVEGGAVGLVITAVNHPDVAAKIHELTESGIPIVTANSDLPNSGRLAYVGSDYFKSGETAAGIMNLICGGRAQIGVVTGLPLILCHTERVEGFTRRIEAAYPGLNIAAREVNYDDDMESFIVTSRMLSEHAEITAVFLAAAGVAGACRAIKDSGRAGEIRVVSYDTPESTQALIRDGVITASIGQQPYTQGSKPLALLLDYMGLGIKPEKEFFYTKLEIKIAENL